MPEMVRQMVGVVEMGMFGNARAMVFQDGDHLNLVRNKNGRLISDSVCFETS